LATASISAHEEEIDSGKEALIASLAETPDLESKTRRIFG
jgi:hypothetical protein